MHDPQAPPSLGVSTAHVSKRWAARIMHGRSDTPTLRDRTTPHQPPATPLHRRLNGAPTPFALRAAPLHSRGPNGHATSRPDPSRDRQRAVARLMHDPQAPPSLGVSTAHVSKRWAARLMHGRSDTPILRDRTTPHQPPATPRPDRIRAATVSERSPGSCTFDLANRSNPNLTNVATGATPPIQARRSDRTPPARGRPCLSARLYEALRWHGQ